MTSRMLTHWEEEVRRQGRWGHADHGSCSVLAAAESPHPEVQNGACAARKEALERWPGDGQGPPRRLRPDALRILALPPGGTTVPRVRGPCAAPGAALQSARASSQVAPSSRGVHTLSGLRRACLSSPRGGHIRGSSGTSGRCRGWCDQLSLGPPPGASAGNRGRGRTRQAVARARMRETRTAKPQHPTRWGPNFLCPRAIPTWEARLGPFKPPSPCPPPPGTGRDTGDLTFGVSQRGS